MPPRVSITSSSNRPDMRRWSGSQSSNSQSARSERRRPRYMPQPSFHLNIGEIVVPRSLPPVRNMSTQTDESALQEQAQVNKLWHRQTLKWLNKWVMPVLRAIVDVLAFLLGRVGFGFRLN